MNDKEWISVEDRLPDAGEEVWVYGEDGVTIGSYGIIRGEPNWSDVYGDGDGLGDPGIYGVTFWMPIDKPEPPK